VFTRFHKSLILETRREREQTYDTTLVARLHAYRQPFFLGDNDVPSTSKKAWKVKTNKYKDSPNMCDFKPWRVPKLFVCIGRQERGTTTSCDLDPEETLLYSKVTPVTVAILEALLYQNIHSPKGCR
jgi:hypothetical protein